MIILLLNYEIKAYVKQGLVFNNNGVYVVDAKLVLYIFSLFSSVEIDFVN